MSISSSVLCSYRSLFCESIRNFNEIGKSTHRIPRLSAENVKILCSEAIEILSHESPLLEIDSNWYVVGDLHGSLPDLLRIFHSYGIPPIQKYVFLGDYIDRCEYSVEVITLLLALKHVYPSKIVLLRGNHEFKETNYLYGFRDQCNEYYHEEIYEEFNKVFSHLPLAAITEDRIILLHGGLSENLKNIDQIRKIPKPSLDYSETPYRQFVLDLVWSDPCVNEKGFLPSQRGTGTNFNSKALEKFLACNNLMMMIRGHQCISTGVERFEGMNLFTVFSCSRYMPDYANLCGVMKISNGKVECYKFPPINRIPKNQACFFDIDPNTCQPLIYHPSLGSSLKLGSLPLRNTRRIGRKYSFSGIIKAQPCNSALQKSPICRMSCSEKIEK